MNEKESLMNTKNYDVVIIGAGSIGGACAWRLSEAGLRTAVIEKERTFGQGQNKAAIGGIRATHSEGCKIALCHESLRIVSTWKEKYGDDIDWIQGGYLYPVYTEKTERVLKDLLKVQKSFGLNIDWIGPDETLEIAKGLRRDGLRGATFSPEDGCVSSLKLGAALHGQAVKNGAEFIYGEEALKVEDGVVVTSKGRYGFGTCVLASGVSDIRSLAGIPGDIFMEHHEAAITEPLAPFTDAMVVDIEKVGNYGSCYFYQNREGQVIFCLSPDPPNMGFRERYNNSAFLPNITRRMLNLVPGLRDVKIRRTWAGYYPMTRDGVPFFEKRGNVIVACGMCGQGLMMGPGVASNVESMIRTGRPLIDEGLFSKLAVEREFSSTELLK